MPNDHKDLNLKIDLIQEMDRDNPDQKELKKAILKFLFTFNVFESEFFEEPKFYVSGMIKKTVSDRAHEIQELCNENNFPLELIKKLQMHFSSIYIKNGKTTERFQSLKNKKNIRAFLEDPDGTKNTAIENALSIAYNFRNNFFHGKKIVFELERFKDDFIVITDFLIELMMCLKEYGAKQF